MLRQSTSVLSWSPSACDEAIRIRTMPQRSHQDEKEKARNETRVTFAIYGAERPLDFMSMNAPVVEPCGHMTYTQSLSAKRTSGPGLCLAARCFRPRP